MFKTKNPKTQKNNFSMKKVKYDGVGGHEG